jgi:serine/threonine protein phosphatase PrpC
VDPGAPGGAAFYLERAMEEAELHPIAGGVAAVFSAPCPGRATANEDAAALIPIDRGSAVLAVADGLGGSPAGEHAAARAVESLADALRPGAREGALLRTAILNGFERANRAVAELGSGAGTTLTVVEIQEDLVRPYHVGDSSILITGRNGRVKLRTVAHSPVGFAVEAGVLDEGEAMHHAERHIVSNVLGAPDMRIEIGPARSLSPHDTVVLASDGLDDNLRTEEIVDCVRKGPVEEGARALSRAARHRMTDPAPGEPSKPDDLTFVLFRLVT